MDPGDPGDPGDAMWWYAHLALQNHDLLPEAFMDLPLETRLFLVASDRQQAETMKNLTKG